MNKIKAIGFDLDQTLYPKSPEIDTAIQKYIYKKIAKHKNCSLDDAEYSFKQYYPAISGRKTLIKLGIPNAAGVVQEALERADLTPWLKPNPEVLKMIKELKAKYGHISLITGSHESICMKKLKALELPRDLFDLVICADIPKSDGSAYRKWIQEVKRKMPEAEADNLLYIGDRYSTDVEVPQKMGINAVLVNVAENKELNVPQFSTLLEAKDLLV